MREKAKKIGKLYDAFEEINKKTGLDLTENYNGRDHFVETRLSYWERDNREEPFGMFQNFEKIRAEYQRYFVKYMQEHCLSEIEELSRNSEDFERVFVSDPKAFVRLFDRDVLGKLSDLAQSFESHINLMISPLKYIKFEWLDRNTYSPEREYRVGSLCGIFSVLKTALARDEPGTDGWNEAMEYVSSRLRLHEALEGESTDANDAAKLEDQKRDEAEVILKTFSLAELTPETNWSVRKLDDLFEALGEREGGDHLAFLKLMTGIIGWAERHNVRKDWMLRYALFFVMVFANEPEIEVEHIEVPTLKVPPLASPIFEFKFREWRADEERREDYEQELREAFEKEIKGYFRFASIELDLVKRKRKTSPRMYHQTEWAVLRAIKGWSLKTILENASDNNLDNSYIGNYSEEYIRKALKRLEEYGLPNKPRRI